MNEKLAAAELAAITPLFCSGGAKFIGKAEDALWIEPRSCSPKSSCCRRVRTPRTTTRTTICRPHRRCGRASSLNRGSAEERDGQGCATADGYRYADLHVGMTFRSPGRTITDADVVAFAGLTGDYSELHTSDVYAKNSQFGRRVAHGMLGLAYAHGLMWARTGELRETAVAFLGIDGLEIRRPDLRRRHDLRELSRSPSFATAESRPTQAIATFDVAVVDAGRAHRAART